MKIVILPTLDKKISYNGLAILNLVKTRQA